MARSTNVNVGIRLSADGRQLIGQAKLSEEQMRKLGREFDRTGRDAQSLNRNTESLAQGFGRLRGLLGALGVSLSVVGMQRLITSTTGALDEIGKLSRSTGIATDDLQRLEFAASQTGVQFRTLTGGLQYFQRQLTENDQVREFAESLDIRHLDTTEQLLAIAQQFEGITDPAERAAAAARLFGRSAGSEMLKLLEEGADGIQKLTNRADELGLVLDEKAIAAAERFNDSWDEVSRSLTATLRAGVMQGLTNDTDEMSDAWYTLTEILTSQELRDGIAAIVAGIVRITGVAAQSIVTITQLTGVLRDLLSGGPAITQEQRDRSALREELQLRRSLETQQAALEQALAQRTQLLEMQAQQEQEIVRQGMQHQIDALGKVIARIEEDQVARQERIAVLEAERKALGEASVVLDAITASADRQSDAYRALLREQRQATRAMAQGNREAEQFAAAFGRLRDQLDPVAAATRQYRDQVDLLDRAWRDGLISGEEHWQLLVQLATGVSEAAEATREMADEAGPWAAAFERAIQDVDRAFVGLWESAFRGFENFADTLKRSFQRLMAELAHATITRPILIRIGMAGALGAPGTASAAGGMPNMLTGGMGNLFGGNAIGMGFQGLGDRLFGAGLPTGNMMTAGTIPNWQFGLAGLGGGLVGSQFGGHGGIGGSLGATIGLAAGGPIGAAVGTVLGGFVGSLFGGKKRDPKLVVGSDTDTGAFLGDRFTETPFGSFGVTGARGMRGEAIEATRSAVLALDTAIADVLSESETEAVTRALDGWRRRGFDMSAAIEERLGLIFEAIDDPLMGLVSAYEGSAEQMIEMFVALRNLQAMTGRNPVAQAAKDFELSNRSAMQVYRDHAAELRTLIAEYDGSMEATYALTHAYAVAQEGAYALAVGLHQVGLEVESVLGNLSERIRQDLIQDEEELYNYRRERVDVLVEALTGMSSPEEILGTIREIEQLTAQMWGSLADEQRQQMGQGFLDFLGDVNQIAQDQIAEALAGLDTDMGSIAEGIDGALTDAANALRDGAERSSVAAATMQAAATAMQQAAGGMQSGASAINAAVSNIRVRVTVDQREVG